MNREKELEERPHEIARLVNRKGDLNKRWYVEFYTRSEEQTNAQRKQVFVPATLKTAEAREGWAKATIKELHELATSGYDFKPLAAKPKAAALPQYTFPQAIELAISTKLNSDRRRTTQTYRSFLNIFNAWINLSGYENVEISQVTDLHIGHFLNWLQVEKKIGNTTYNNYLQRLTTAFNTLIKQEIVAKNPCHLVEALPEEASKNVPLNFHQRLTIEKYLQENDRPLFKFTRFLYFTFLRPSELVQLKIKDIDLKNRQIIVPASVSKNKKEEFVAIPKILLAEMAPMRLDKYDVEDYVFSKNLLPGPAKIYPTHVSEMHRLMLQACGIKQKDISLYSWRHTGFANAYKAGIDIKTLQIHLRHQNMEMTNSYLERLGLGLKVELEQREW
jgi:integrase